MVVLRRDLILAAVACLGAAALAAPAGAGPASFFTDPVAFQQALQDAGKQPKFVRWDFKPDNLPAGQTSAKVGNGLNIRTHSSLPLDPWTDADGTSLWPDDVDNITFFSNSTPGQNPLTPLATSELKYLKPNDPAKLIDNNALLSQELFESFSIVSGPVNMGGPNHTAMELEILSIKGQTSPLINITVFDKGDLVVGKFQLPPGGGAVGKQFLGILMPTGQTIGRVDIWDEGNGKEGISSITAYVPGPGSIALLGFAGLAARRRRRLT